MSVTRLVPTPCEGATCQHPACVADRAAAAAADFPAAAAAVDAGQLAERVATLVLAELRQGVVPTSLPAWAGELLAEWSKSGQIYQRTPVLYPAGSGYVELETRLVDGRLVLALWINGGRVWDVSLGCDRG